MNYRTLDEAMPYSFLSRAKSFAQKAFGAGDTAARGRGDLDLKNSSVKAKKIITQWMSRQKLTSVTPNELKNSGLVKTPGAWDEAVANAGLTASVDKKINDSMVNTLLIEYLKLLYKYQSAEQDTPEPPPVYTPSSTPAAGSTGTTSTAPPPMPLTYANVLSFVQKRMDPKQAGMVLSRLSESALMEKGEFKTNKLIAAINTFTPAEQAEIKKALALKAKLAKKSVGSPTAGAGTPAATTTAPVSPTSISVSSTSSSNSSSSATPSATSAAAPSVKSDTAANTNNQYPEIGKTVALDGEVYRWSGNQWALVKPGGKLLSGQVKNTGSIGKKLFQLAASSNPIAEQVEQQLREKYQKFLSES